MRVRRLIFWKWQASLVAHGRLHQQKLWTAYAAVWLRLWGITRGWVRKAGFVGIIIMEGQRPFASKLSANSKRRNRPSQAVSAQVLTNLLWQKASIRRAARLTWLPVDAGASLRTACALAAIHSLVDSASATEADVRASIVHLSNLSYPSAIWS